MTLPRPTHLFIGGLHRSGTTLLASLLAEHPEVSWFGRTGAPEGEGQYLQTVCPVDEHHGGPGRFAFVPDAHLTERSPFAAPEPARRLREQWDRYWDLTCPVLLEKSPPNLLRFRLLQQVFPGSRFVLLIRHPVPVSLSTRTWTPSLGPEDLLEHWLHAHRIAFDDLAHLTHVRTVRYEELVASPADVLARITAFAGVGPTAPEPDAVHDADAGYLDEWRRHVAPRMNEATLERLETRVRRYGYSLHAGEAAAAS